MRVVYFDYFRALAIVLIVIGHCGGAWAPGNLLGATIANYIQGCTALFVFISGYFLHKVYKDRFQSSEFLKLKAKRLVPPYLILSVSYMLAFYLVKGEVSFIRETGSLVLDKSLTNFILNLATGQTLIGYWYIPFAMLLFSTSAVILQLVSKSGRNLIVLLSISFAVSMYVQRPSLNLNILQSLIYFFPFYLLGAFYSKYSDLIESQIDRHLWIFLTLSLGFSIYMSAVGQIGILNKSTVLGWNGLDLMVIQKVLFIPAVIGILRVLQRRKLPNIKFLADTSFALYFIHPWVLSVMSFLEVSAYFPEFYGLILKALLVLAVSLSAIYIVKHIFPKKSVLLIGA